MDQWRGKLAIVTGASSGIGEDLSIAFVQHGINVVGLARRLENMNKLAAKMKNAKGTFHPVACDLTNEEDILKAFKLIETLGGADILVNNAGVGYGVPIIESPTEKLRAVVELNLLAVAICTREAVQSFKKRKAAGYIININSVLGHDPHLAPMPTCMYDATKSALITMSETLKREILELKLPIKITSLSPGLVNTSLPFLKDAGLDREIEKLPHLETKDVIEAIIYLLSTPPHVQVKELTVAALFADTAPYKYR
ncbi:dehydrogenase/reductase SDR family member 11-like [Xylocopa sonorina]|uniref:dehydrogenase/reductase SDR family member 11-like n=1 Tax=Xylocopa sonorina TaxID=1818115 RepID=UPI00403A91D5